MFPKIINVSFLDIGLLQKKERGILCHSAIIIILSVAFDELYFDSILSTTATSFASRSRCDWWGETEKQKELFYLKLKKQKKLEHLLICHILYSMQWNIEIIPPHNIYILRRPTNRKIEPEGRGRLTFILVPRFFCREHFHFCETYIRHKRDYTI